jgi:response regulator NasT
MFSGTSLALFADMEPRWRVLMIGESAASLAAVTAAVTEEGGQVVASAAGLEDASRLLDLHRPDVAVLAADRDASCGVEAARQIMTTHPCALVLLTSSIDPHVAVSAAAAGVVGLLATPPSGEGLRSTLDLALAQFRTFQAVRKENELLKRKLESRRLIDRAKALLIERLNLTEPEAHRRIQKAAMDSRRTMADIAQSVLVGEEPRRSRSSK